MSTLTVPPLPAGYSLEPDSNTPPLPAGYKLEWGQNLVTGEGTTSDRSTSECADENVRDSVAQSGTTAALPAVGTVAGGAVGSAGDVGGPLGIATTAGGAGLGAAAGKQAELLINRALFGKDEIIAHFQAGIDATAVSYAVGAATGRI